MRKTVPQTARLAAIMALLAACSPEVGSGEWCEDLKNKPKGEWTANQVADYSKHCVFK